MPLLAEVLEPAGRADGEGDHIHENSNTLDKVYTLSVGGPFVAGTSSLERFWDVLLTGPHAELCGLISPSSHQKVPS